MSYVHFLDVFDPEGLSSGLAGREAAEQARHQRLAEPSPRLLALLTRIRQQPPGITVNVGGGKDLDSVEWVDGDPPRVEGEGAKFALWTLILPVDEEFDTEDLEDVLPDIRSSAEVLGLRVFDETREAGAQEVAKPAPAAVPAVADEELPRPGDILVLDWVYSPVSQHIEARKGWTLRQTVKWCMARNQLDGYTHIKEERPALQRLLVRLLQFFPFETHGQSLGCGHHPVAAPLHTTPGLRLLRVAPEHRAEVLKRLMPLARELFLTVVLHDEELFVERCRLRCKVQGESLLLALDPDWKKHHLTTKQQEKRLTRALSDALLPHGFVQTPEKDFPNTFVRPLRSGGGQQVIRVSEGHLTSYVQSERLLSVGLACGFSNSWLLGMVMSFNENSLVEMDGSDEHVWRGGTHSEEEIAWAIEDVQRILLPALDRLNTAQDYWELMSRPTESFPGLHDLNKFQEWSLSKQAVFDLKLPIYAARCMPDEVFQPLLQIWREAAEAYRSQNPEHPGINNTLKLLEGIGQLTQTPLDGPL